LSDRTVNIARSICARVEDQSSENWAVCVQSGLSLYLLSLNKNLSKEKGDIYQIDKQFRE
jgi:hypothetical protein